MVTAPYIVDDEHGVQRRRVVEHDVHRRGTTTNLMFIIDCQRKRSSPLSDNEKEVRHRCVTTNTMFVTVVYMRSSIW